MSESDPRLQGTVSTGFEPVRDAFEAMLIADSTFSAQVTIYHHDKVVVDLAGGGGLRSDSITGVFSCTKGATALTLATLVADGLLDLDNLVSVYWPEFAAAGKQDITIRELFSHKAGLVNVDGCLSTEEILTSKLGAARLADQLPLWLPGTAFGYHGITIGILAEELVRRVTSSTLQQLYESRIRAPRQIDLYLGLPNAEETRFIPVRPPAQTAVQANGDGPSTDISDGFAAMMFNAVNAPLSIDSGPLSPNDPAFRAAGPAAIGAVGSASGLARMYAAALGHAGDPLVPVSVLRSFAQQQAWGIDRVIGQEMGFGVLFMKPTTRIDFGSYQAFGHDGAGGALGFADPLYDLSFGYIPMPRSSPGGADERGLRLSKVARRCALART